MAPGPKAFIAGARSEGSMPEGVTFVHTPRGHVPASTHGSGGGGPASSRAPPVFEPPLPPLPPLVIPPALVSVELDTPAPPPPAPWSVPLSFEALHATNTINRATP